ncbi:MAG: ribosomal protein S18-alanine N-acetyltransferase [Clostridia bacterium]|nr:ribosomal protein S18-alanine N-acetyltransferase [Clostridia bacterium]
MRKIIFVCTGNTCRSPMAEGYLKSKQTDFEIISRGLTADGLPVSSNSKIAMEKIGIDISSHTSKQLTKEEADSAHLIVCMSPSHAQFLTFAGVDEEKIRVLGVDDPYGCDLSVYEECRDQIIKGIDKLFNGVDIREFKEKDEIYIAMLEKECFSEPWSEKAILDAKENNTLFVVAQAEEKIIGYAGLQIVLDEGYITNVAVTKEHRGKGVAKALMEKLFKIAEEKDLAFITLEVRESNLAAINLYKKLGFEKEGERKNFYVNPKENGHIMTKRRK